MIDPNDMREVWVVETYHVRTAAGVPPRTGTLRVCLDAEHARAAYKEACASVGCAGVVLRGPFAPGEDLLDGEDRRVVRMLPAV